jgi:class 3 adenylate cyclase
MVPARRSALWIVALLAPLAGFLLLLAAPMLDVRWEDHPTHFWLVLAAAAITAALAYATGEAARRRRDARLFLVSLGFVLAAGFLGLHALATPGVLLDKRNAGFVIATPVGLAAAAGFAAASSLRWTRARTDALMGNGRAIELTVFAVMVAWAVVSLARVPPLDDPTPAESGSGPLVALAVVGLVLYAYAAARYLELWRASPALLLVCIAAAWVLLAEAMIAVAFARNWHATWWEWHLLMLGAFALVAWSARRQWSEERFSALYGDETAAAMRDVSVVFADLAGFTSFSEGRDPRQVSAMLNAYFERAIPAVVREHGGEIDRLIGDAVMATFNRRGDQPDHAVRAARAALALQESTAAIAADHPEWPRFRAGVNSGEAMVGVVGAEGGRSYTVIGDTVNLAARLEALAPIGGVAIGPETRRALGNPEVDALGSVEVKGKAEPVEAFLLRSVDPS